MDELDDRGDTCLCRNHALFSVAAITGVSIRCVAEILAQTLANLIESDGRHVRSDMFEEQMPMFFADEKTDFYQIFDAAGRSIERSGSLAQHSFAFNPTKEDGFAFVSTTIPGGHRVRAVSTTFVPRREPIENETDVKEDADQANQVSPDAVEPITLVVAQTSDRFTQTLARIRLLIASMTILTVLAGVCTRR